MILRVKSTINHSCPSSDWRFLRLFTGIRDRGTSRLATGNTSPSILSASLLPNRSSNTYRRQITVLIIVRIGAFDNRTSNGVEHPLGGETFGMVIEADWFLLGDGGVLGVC